MSEPDPWRAVALALTPDPSSPWAWTGTLHDAPVRLEVVPRGPARRDVRVVFPIGRPDLVLLPAALALSEAGRTPTGDADLDRRIHLRAPDVVDLGCFDATTRLRALELVALGAHVAGGELRLEPWAGQPELAPDAVAPTLERLAALARALAIPRALALSQLAAVALRDPDVSVRAAFMRHAQATPELADALARELARRTPEEASADAFELLEGQLAVPTLDQKSRYALLVKLLYLFPPERCAPVVRRLAGVRATRVLAFRALLRHLGRSGVELAPWLDLLADEVLGLPIPLDVAEAIAATCGASGDPAALPCLVGLAQDEEPRVFVAAMQALTRLPLSARALFDALPVVTRWRALRIGPELFGDRLPHAIELVVLIYGERDDTLPVTAREAYMRALGEHGDGRVQDLLLEGLEHFDEQVKVNAIEALKAVGDGRALAALRPLTSGLFRSGRVKAAAREASDVIRARVGEGGGLALSAEGGAGGLTVARDEDP
ncbi:MAG: HEAT repeat domain-containing protein [Deltaproteobacteria bacterium]|nr:HEAT repeat domain-containing protein [Deltaproteobacteria bacterium]